MATLTPFILEQILEFMIKHLQLQPKRFQNTHRDIRPTPSSTNQHISLILVKFFNLNTFKSTAFTTFFSSMSVDPLIIPLFHSKGSRTSSIFISSVTSSIN